MVIYKIYDVNKGYCYYGKTQRDPSKRKKEHFTLLSKNLHHNTFLQNIFNKRPKDLHFKVIKTDILTIEELNRLEEEFIKNNGSINIHKGGSGGDNITAHPHREKLRTENKVRNNNRVRENYIRNYGTIYEYTKNGILVRSYESIKDVEEFGFVPIQVRYCVEGKLKTHRNAVFFSQKTLPDNIPIFLKQYLVDKSKGVSRGSLLRRLGEAGKLKKIQQLKENAKKSRIKVKIVDNVGDKVRTCDSLTEAGSYLGATSSAVGNYLRGKKTKLFRGRYQIERL